MAVVSGPVGVLLAVLLMAAALRVWAAEAASLRCACGCVAAVIVLKLILRRASSRSAKGLRQRRTTRPPRHAMAAAMKRRR